MSCLIDRASSKIAFISSTEGGVDIEAVAQKNPEKIITTKVDFKKNLGLNDLKNILKIFKFDKRQMESATKLVNAMYEALISKDASLAEVAIYLATEPKPGQLSVITRSLSIVLGIAIAFRE